MSDINTRQDLFAHAASEGFILTPEEKRILRGMVRAAEGDLIAALITLEEWMAEDCLA